jgi:hypothetical protein
MARRTRGEANSSEGGDAHGPGGQAGDRITVVCLQIADGEYDPGISWSGDYHADVMI